MAAVVRHRPCRSGISAVKIFLLVFLVTAFAVQFVIGVLWIFRIRDEARIGKLWAALRPAGGPGEPFAPGMLDGLPEPARRYLAHAIAPGTPLARAVELRMTGAVSTDGRKWLPLAAEEIVAPGRGFIWRANARLGGPLRLRAIDHYADGAARMLLAFQGLITMTSKTGPDLARSAAGRLLSESIWLPSALLPERGAAWEGIDADHARVRLAVGDVTAVLTLTIDAEGRPVSVVLPRWKDAPGGRWEEAPFGVFVEEETAFEGYAIPTRLRAGWWPGTEKYLEFARFSVEGATFL